MTAWFWIRDDAGELVAYKEVQLPPVTVTGQDAYEAAQRVGHAVELALLNHLGPAAIAAPTDADQLLLELEPDMQQAMREGGWA